MRSIILVSLVLIIFFSTIGNISAATYSVHSTWSGADYTTIQDAVDASSDGESVWVLDGTYQEQVSVDVEITIFGNGTGNTVVDANGLTGFNVSARNVTISNLNVSKCDFGINSTGLGLQVNDTVIVADEEGVRLWLHDMGMSLSGDQSFIVGDTVIQNNNITTNGIAITLVAQSWGYGCSGNSTVSIGTIDISMNEITSDIGIDLNKTADLGTYLTDRASFEWGGLVINDNEMNVTTSALSGRRESLRQWGINLEDNSTVTIGDIEVVGNSVDSKKDGIRFPALFYIGRYLYDNSTLTMGDFLVSRNHINATGNDPFSALQFNAWAYLGNYMYNRSCAIIGDIDLSGNTINTTANYGIFMDNYQFVGYRLYDNATFTLGCIYLNDNDVSAVDKWDDIGIGIKIDGISMIAWTCFNDSVVRVGDINFLRNTVRADDMGISLTNLNYWGYRVEGCNFSIGNMTFADNTVISGGDGIEISKARYHGAVIINGSMEFGSWKFTRNDIDAGGYGLEISGQRFQALRMNGSSWYSNKGLLVEDNTIISEDHGIFISKNNDDHGKYLNDTTNVTFGDRIVRNNTIDSRNGNCIMIGFADLGVNVNDSASAVFGNIVIADNRLSGFQGINISQMAYFGNNLSGNGYVKIGDLIVERNLVNVSDSGIFSENDEAFVCWGYGMWGSSRFRAGNISFSSNGVDSGNWSALKVQTFKDWGMYLHDDAFVRIGTIDVSDNHVNGTGTNTTDGLTVEGCSNHGGHMYDFSTFIRGTLQIERNHVNASRYRCIDLDDVQYLGTYLYGNSTVSIGSVQIIDNEVYSIYQGSRGIQVYGYRDLGTHMYDNSSVVIGDFECLGNNILKAHHGFYLHGFNQWGWGSDGDFTVTIGNFSINDNIINSTWNGIYHNGFYRHASDCDGGTISIGNIEYNRNDIQSGRYGIYVDGHIWRGYDVTLSEVELGNFTIEENNINAELDCIHLGRSFGWFGSTVWGSSVSIGAYSISDNQLVVNEHAGINLTIYNIGTDLNFSHVEMEPCMIERNTIIGHEGITLWKMMYNGMNSSNATFRWLGTYVENNNMSNGRDGIKLVECKDITIINNTIDTFTNFGLYLEVTDGVSAEFNLINGSGTAGIRIYNSTKTDVQNNTVRSGGRGISLYESNQNNFIYNDVYNNSQHGIHLKMSHGNVIHHNNFMDNGVSASQGYDSTGNNTWDNGTHGNWWSDYSGSDNDSNGIGDVEYEIDGHASSQDDYPLMNTTTTSSPEPVPEFGPLLVMSILGVMVIVTNRRRIRN